LRPGSDVSEAEVRAFCRKRLAAVKVPAVVRFSKEIPRGATGKILKRVLRERANGCHHAGERAKNSAIHEQNGASKDDVKKWIDTWLQANLEPADAHVVDDRTAFADLGMDSILSVRLASELGAWLGREIAVTAAWSFTSAEAMAEHVTRNGYGRQPDHVCIAGLSEDAAQALLLAELEQLNR